MAFTKAFGDAFKTTSGVLVKQDSSCGTEGAIQAQFGSGKPSWDVIDADPFSAESLGKKGVMEEIDYSIVDKSKMRPGYGWKYAASSYFYSYVIAYDSSKFADKAPTGMADFFDVQKFPGKRSLYKWGAGMWEAALLADGVTPDKLYPLDLDRAHKKLAAFKEHVVSYWGGGGEAASVLLNGEATMALIWSSRASAIERDSGGSIKFTWSQGLLEPGSMAVLKGGPGGKENAMKFIASAQDPKKQIVLFNLLGMGPTNPAADPLIPEDRRRFNPVDPGNMSKQIPLDVGWYETHYAAALDAYTKVIAS
jgi:putative spermidine/putrescine transport system substrate-binding protein